MDRDGTKAGFDLALTRAIADAVPVPVIASGGVGDLDHFVEGVTEAHATGLLAASVVIGFAPAVSSELSEKHEPRCP